MFTLNPLVVFSFVLIICAQTPSSVSTQIDQLLNCTTSSSSSNDEPLKGCLNANVSESISTERFRFQRDDRRERSLGKDTRKEDCAQEKQTNKEPGEQPATNFSWQNNISFPSNLGKPLALLQRTLTPIEIYIRTPNNETRFDLGSALTLECRFNTNSKDLRFNLRWLRSVNGSRGDNQSVTSTDTDDSSMTIIAVTTRIWSVPRNGGLDLELNDFQANDSGDYYCQAVSPQSDSNILGSAKVRLSLMPGKRNEVNASKDLRKSLNNTDQGRQTRLHNSTGQAIQSQGYSQENLSKLLPSLKVLPEFSEVAQGDNIQLVCVTNELDPDPNPSEVMWSFEPINRSKSPLLVSQNQNESSLIQLLPNITIRGNILVIWSMSASHCGLYKCSVDLLGFNLTAQATGELALRPSIDSAPLVFVSPELIRLSPNGSATIQCEATGYPPPSIIWYRVDGHQQHQLASSAQDNRLITTSDNAIDADTSITAAGSADELKIDGIEFEKIAYKDLMAYCQQNKCFATSYQYHHQPQQQQTHQLTGISLIHLSGARAAHQGQYVCRANNKHGSNQASSVIDVEFKEPPKVEIGQQYKEQTIVLPAETPAEEQKGNNQQQRSNVTFKCTILSGRPQPKLGWIRTTRNNNKLLNGTLIDHRNIGSSSNINKNLDIYDLTKASSVTSNVSVYAEDSGKSLVLVISTISLDDEGDYVCLGENEWGRHSDLARLYVRKPVSVKIPQSSPFVARVNDSFHLDCLASGYPVPLDIEWSRSDKGAFFSLISRTSSDNGLHGSQERAMLKFDRVSSEESGEYTCNARDPLDPTIILRDTIMVVVEDTSKHLQGHSEAEEQRFAKERAAQQPKLMVRPTKVNAPLGSNVTLDCLTVSGLQPTIVEWIGPPQLLEAGSGQSNHSLFGSDSGAYLIGRPYNRANPATTISGQLPMLQQFGSKLKIFNVSKAHEGVYQCKGSNKVGVENAPALIRVLDNTDLSGQIGSGPDYYPNGRAEFLPNAPAQLSGINDELAGQTNIGRQAAKTKIARLGLNIELKCQVNGVDQPATSWSREGLELPASSVQIGHNLWIQNVTQKDNGLYICSARSKQPNKLIQAKINLLVQDDLDEATMSKVLNLNAKIVASKSQVAVGDSITLECIISQPQQQNQSSSSQQVADNTKSVSTKPIYLDEIERNVVWTNLHSDQSLFQDNVYIQHNLLIIYELRPENSATYRCNYNDLMQHTDYHLQVLSSAGDQLSTQSVGAGGGQDSIGQEQSKSTLSQHGKQSSENITHLTASSGRSVELRQVALGSRVKLDCPLLNVTITNGSLNSTISYYWTRGSGEETQLVSYNGPLIFNSISTHDADIYHCHQSTLHQKPLADAPEGVYSFVGSIGLKSILLNVLIPVAKFVQRPVSFITLPAISGANQQLEIELKFFPERDNGLILFSGQQQPAQANQRLPAPSGGDYISLGLNRGFLEFRFELGDGTTLLRSLQSLALNQWHKVLIERNKRGAVMYLDKQPPVSNSSIGKFFDLNLDSVLYVGGHQHFLASSSSLNLTNGNRTSASTTPAVNWQQQQLNSSQKGRNHSNNSYINRYFYGYSRGFEGCISLLRISRQQINLMARNRSVALGVYECDKPECKQQDHCDSPNGGVCQVDPLGNDQLGTLSSLRYSPTIDSTRRVSPNAEVRCICLPGLSGDRCERTVLSLPTEAELLKIKPLATNNASSLGEDFTNNRHSQRTNSIGGACDLLKPCASNGTLKCESFTSTSYKCHCRIGFMGPTCALAAQFSSQTRVWFNQQAYLQFRFNRPEESIAYLRAKSEQLAANQQPQGLLSFLTSSTETTTAAATTTTTEARENNEANRSNSIENSFNNLNSFNASKFSLLTQMTETQNISFKLHTKSSYGLIFYTGLATSPESAREQLRWEAQGAGEKLGSPDGGGSLKQQRLIGAPLAPTPAPPMQTSKSVVANLLSRLSNMVFDYVAIALVDGHVELSYELGSGVAIIRSSQRVNDGEEHRIRVIRQGKFARLIIDGQHKQEGSAPGKLWILNSQPDIYLGGLPHLAELTNNMYMSGFTGCLSELEINSLGPLNLINSNHLTQVLSARNLAPCSNISASSAGTALPTTTTAATTPATAAAATTAEADLERAPVTRNYRYSTPKSDDDSDDT